MKSNVTTLRQCRSVQEFIEELSRFEAELREKLPKFGTIGEVILEEILGE